MEAASRVRGRDDGRRGPAELDDVPLIRRLQGGGVVVDGQIAADGRGVLDDEVLRVPLVRQVVELVLEAAPVAGSPGGRDGSGRGDRGDERRGGEQGAAEGGQRRILAR